MLAPRKVNRILPYKGCIFTTNFYWSISTSKLNKLPHLHFWPIKLVIY